MPNTYNRRIRTQAIEHNPYAAIVMCVERVAYGVSATTSGSMLDPDDLTPADESVLDLMHQGRVTAPYAAEETGYTIQYVRDTLTDLRKHGHVERVHKGLYELVNDPRDDYAE